MSARPMLAWAIAREGKLVRGTVALLRAWAWEQFHDRAPAGWAGAGASPIAWDAYLNKIRAAGYRAVRVSVSAEGRAAVLKKGRRA